MSDVAEPFLEPDAPGSSKTSQLWHLIPALLTEFIGTFFLVLTVHLSVAPDPTGTPPEGIALQPPLAIGSVLMTMIYMGGHISGGHYNPAVTTGVCLRGHMELHKAAAYVISQVLGGICAALIGWAVTGNTIDLAPGPHYHTGGAFCVEVFYTFALVSVVLNVATTKSQHNNMFFGIAIGFTVISGVSACSAISGGVFNPAVGTGLLVARAADGHSAQYIWLYWVAPLVGGITAAIIFRVTNRKEYAGVDNPTKQGFRNLEIGNDEEGGEINK